MRQFVILSHHCIVTPTLQLKNKICFKFLIFTQNDIMFQSQVFEENIEKKKISLSDQENGFGGGKIGFRGKRWNSDSHGWDQAVTSCP